MENERDELEGTATFVIRMWVEETGKAGGRGTWRGNIEHIPSGNRRYFQSIEEMNAFLIPYLERMGVEV